MSISRDDISFILQGPLNSIGLSCVPEYLKYGSVIISTWRDSDLSLLKSLGENVGNVLLVVGDRSEIEDYKNDTYDNVGNSALQLLSSLNGLNHSKTKYSIKVRCDEYLPKWDEFLTRMAAGKFVHSNRFSRRSVEAYHLGDTYFGGSTETLKKALTWGAEMALNNRFKDLEVCGQKRHLSAEQKITISILKALEPENQLNDPVGDCRRYFDICPLSEMGDFAVNSSGWKKDGLPNPRYEFNAKWWGCISSLNEL